jgi:UDP-glucose 6-dehydrogenase
LQSLKRFKVLFISVGTPPDEDGIDTDLKYVLAVAEDVE